MKTFEEFLIQKIKEINPDWNYGNDVEEIFKSFWIFFDPGIARQYISKWSIEFAKSHVQQALEIASENAYTKEESVYNGGMDPNKSNMYNVIQVIDQDSILNCYPLENIK